MKKGNWMKEIRAKTGMSQVRFGKHYGIPERTIQDWETEQRTPSLYIQEMLNKIIETDKIIPVAYCYYEAFDGGEVKLFKEKDEAVKYARKCYKDRSENDWKQIKKEGGFAEVTLTEVEWDEINETYIMKENGWIQDVWSNEAE